MSVKIRLMRMGGKRKPFYRFVVMDSRKRRDGAYLDSLGYYNPIVKPFDIKIDEEKALMWLGRGAQLTEGARSLLNKAGILKKWESRRGGVETAQPSAAEESDEGAAGTRE